MVWTNAQKVAANYPNDELKGYTLAYSKELQASPVWKQIKQLDNSSEGVRQGTGLVMSQFERPSAAGEAAHPSLPYRASSRKVQLRGNGLRGLGHLEPGGTGSRTNVGD
jgi:hypothetical protein